MKPELLDRFVRAFHLSRYRADPREEIRDEIRFYLDMRAREFVEREGMTPEEAREAARRVFGDLEGIEEEVVRIDVRERKRKERWTMMAAMMHDLKWSFRAWRRSPGLTAVALVTLALGIGVTTAVFSLADRVLLRAPPVEDPDELVRVYTTCQNGEPRCSSSWPDYLEYRERADALRGLAAYSGVPVNVSGHDAAFLASATVVSGDYFQLLGLTPAAGRLLQPGDNARGGANAVAVISHGAWQDRFGADAGLVGATVDVNGSSFEVVGVAPEGFHGLDLGDDTDIWIPVHAGPLLGDVGSVSNPDAVARAGNRWISGLVGRLAPGATVARVRSQMAAVSNQLQEDDSEARGGRGVTVDASPRYTIPSFSRAETVRLVGLLAAVVALTLVLTCANTANLLLARAEGRRREIGVRASLGAGRGHILGQLLTESVVLSVVGGLLGLAVARGGLSYLTAYELPGGIPLGAVGLGLDARVFGFALGLSVITGLAFGVAPALRAGRTDVVTALKGESSLDRGRPSRTRSALVALQVGLSLVLLVGAGLFLQTLRNGFNTELGFRTEGVALARYNLTLLKYEPDEAQRLLDRTLERVRSLPGVESAAAGTLVPLQIGGHTATFVEVEGYQPAPEERIRAEYVFTTPDYFRTLGMPLLAGRTLEPGDRSWPPESAVINRSMARRYWSRPTDAMGGVIRFGGQAIRVVGVVEDATWRTLEDPEVNFIFVSMYPGAAAGSTTLAARTAGDAHDLLPSIRSQVRELEPRLSFNSLDTMEDQLGRVLMAQRLAALLLSSLGALALVLAGVGIWGVVSYAVGRRTREMGIRIALGASRGRVLGTAMRDMLRPVLLGLLAGAGAAWALARTVEAFMYGVAPTDPVTFAATAAVLAAVAALATFLPAHRATRVDPTRALTAE